MNLKVLEIDLFRLQKVDEKIVELAGEQQNPQEGQSVFESLKPLKRRMNYYPKAIVKLEERMKEQSNTKAY